MALTFELSEPTALVGGCSLVHNNSGLKLALTVHNNSGRKLALTVNNNSGPKLALTVHKVSAIWQDAADTFGTVDRGGENALVANKSNSCNSERFKTASLPVVMS